MTDALTPRRMSRDEIADLVRRSRAAMLDVTGHVDKPRWPRCSTCSACRLTGHRADSKQHHPVIAP